MDNPGGGTSTVMWCDDERICYKRGLRSLFYVNLSDLFESYDQFRGKKVTTNDLKEMNRKVYDSKQKGHNCHCTLLFMALLKMGVVNAINGSGKRGNPYWIFIPAAETK